MLIIFKMNAENDRLVIKNIGIKYNLHLQYCSHLILYSNFNLNYKFN